MPLLLLLLSITELLSVFVIGLDIYLLSCRFVMGAAGISQLLPLSRTQVLRDRSGRADGWVPPSPDASMPVSGKPQKIRPFG